MQYAEIPYVEKKVSRILFGSCMEPFLSGGDDDALLDAMTELGVTSIDTARMYGGAEEVLGRWMEKRGNRDQIVLLSKCAHHDVDTMKKRISETEIRKDFAISSEKLRTPFIDIYLLHRDDPDVPAGEVVEIMNALHAEGKIGAFGGSNWTVERIEEANEYAYSHGLIPFSVSSPNFGLAVQVRDPWGGGAISISGEEGADARAWYIRNKMPVIAYSSLGRGFFTGKLKSTDEGREDQILDKFAVRGYSCPENFERLRRCEELAAQKQASVAQVAMSWIFRQKLDVFAVVSTSSAERMRSNIEALSLELTEVECRYLEYGKE